MRADGVSSAKYSKYLIREIKFNISMKNKIGKTIFLTKEEAE